MFAALGDPTRLAMLRRLSDGEPLAITRLAGDSRLSRQAVTKHLRVLEGAGLVASGRFGRERRFALRQEGLADAAAYLERVSAGWDAALDRLRRHVTPA